MRPLKRGCKEKLIQKDTPIIDVGILEIARDQCGIQNVLADSLEAQRFLFVLIPCFPFISSRLPALWFWVTAADTGVTASPRWSNQTTTVYGPVSGINHIYIYIYISTDLLLVIVLLWTNLEWFRLECIYIHFYIRMLDLTDVKYLIQGYINSKWQKEAIFDLGLSTSKSPHQTNLS